MNFFFYLPDSLPQRESVVSIEQLAIPELSLALDAGVRLGKVSLGQSFSLPIPQQASSVLALGHARPGGSKMAAAAPGLHPTPPSPVEKELLLTSTSTRVLSPTLTGEVGHP